MTRTPFLPVSAPSSRPRLSGPYRHGTPDTRLDRCPDRDTRHFGLCRDTADHAVGAPPRRTGHCKIARETGYSRLLGAPTIMGTSNLIPLRLRKGSLERE